MNCGMTSSSRSSKSLMACVGFTSMAALIKKPWAVSATDLNTNVVVVTNMNMPWVEMQPGRHIIHNGRDNH